MYEILCILLGWLLGLLSPTITNKISNGYKKKSLQKNIKNDLIDLKYRLVSVPMLVYSSYGKLDKDTFIWTRDNTGNFEEYKKNKDIEDENDLEKIKKLIQDDENIDDFLSKYNSLCKKNNHSFHFKKMLVSITDSNLMNFEILESDFVSKILDIKFQINAFNEEVQNVNEYLKMTFDSSITEDNHKIISKEIENKNLLIAEKSKVIVDKVNSFINNFYK